MDSAPAVFINKPRFFGTLTRSLVNSSFVLLACVVVLGGYGVYLSRKPAPEFPVAEFLCTMDDPADDWHTLSPVLAAAFAVHRDPDYRDNIHIKTEIHPSGEEYDGDEAVIVVEVVNSGDEVVSLLAARLRVENDSDEHVDLPVLVASPFMVEDHWRGPLLPGTARRIAQRVTIRAGKPNVSLEVSDLRTWRCSGRAPHRP